MKYVALVYSFGSTAAVLGDDPIAAAQELIDEGESVEDVEIYELGKKFTVEETLAIKEVK